MAEIRGKKVAVAGLSFESNSFSPGLTNIDAFKRHVIAEGPEEAKAPNRFVEFGEINRLDNIGIYSKAVTFFQVEFLSG